MEKLDAQQRDNVDADPSSIGQMFDDLTRGSSDQETLATLERTIAIGLPAFEAVGKALLQIRDEKLYRFQFNSFEAYCRERWTLEHSHAYQLMRAAEVVKNLENSATAEVLPTREYQTRALASLSPEHQVKAWTEAVAATGNGKPPTGGVVRKIVARIQAKMRTEKRQNKLAEGWTEEDLKRDASLSSAFDLLQKVYGEEETDLIRQGIIQLRREDLLFLTKQTPAMLNEIHELVIGNRWTPEHAVKFVGSMPDDNTTVEELKNYCLATKAKCYTATIGGFTVTVKGNRVALRR